MEAEVATPSADGMALLSNSLSSSSCLLVIDEVPTNLQEEQQLKALLQAVRCPLSFVGIDSATRQALLVFEGCVSPSNVEAALTNGAPIMRVTKCSPTMENLNPTLQEKLNIFRSKKYQDMENCASKDCCATTAKQQVMIHHQTPCEENFEETTMGKERGSMEPKEKVDRDMEEKEKEKEKEREIDVREKREKEREKGMDLLFYMEGTGSPRTEIELPGREDSDSESDDDIEEVEIRPISPRRKRSTHSICPPEARLDFENAVLTIHKKGALYNFRDITYFPTSVSCNQVRHILATTEGKALNSGIIYRSACWSRTPDITDGIVMTTCTFLQDMGIKTLVDLRASQEKGSDPLDEFVEKFYPTADPSKRDQKYRRYPKDLFNSRMKYRGLLMNTPANVYMQMAASVFRSTTNSPFLSRRLSRSTSLSSFSFRNSRNRETEVQEEEMPDIEEPESLEKIFAQGVFNPIGLNGFTKLFIIHAGKEIGEVLRLCIDTTQHPILLHCTSGKDRTGLVVALILTVCGVARDDVIDSYHLSEVFLLPIMDEIQKYNRSKGLNENFDGCPKWVMRDVLEYIDKRWGSVEAYLNSACYFTYKEQQQLREIMVAPPRRRGETS